MLQICVLLSEHPTWRVARGLISDENFTERLRNLDPKSVRVRCALCVSADGSVDHVAPPDTDCVFVCCHQSRNIHIVEKLIRANDLVVNARSSNSRVRRCWSDCCFGFRTCSPGGVVCTSCPLLSHRSQACPCWCHADIACPCVVDCRFRQARQRQWWCQSQ